MRTRTEETPKIPAGYENFREGFESVEREVAQWPQWKRDALLGPDYKPPIRPPRPVSESLAAPRDKGSE